MNFKLFSKLAMCIGAAIAFTSCDLDDDGSYTVVPDNVAYGVIVNASPNSGDLYFYADENQVNSTGISYTGASGYYNFYTGDRTLSIKDADGMVLDTNDVTLEAGEFFSMFAVNTFDNIELVTYTDSLEYPASGKAYVRFINLAPDAPAINIAGLNNTFATGLEFKAATDFIEVASGTYDISYSNADTEEELFSETGVNLLNGHIYTIYTKGYVSVPAGSNETFSTELLRNY